MIYIFVFVLMIFSWGLSFVTDYLPKKTLDIIFCVIACLMIIISATRPDTGVSDMHNYEDMFSNYDSLKYQLTVEPTYLYLSALLNFLGGGFRVILWIYAMLAIPLKLYAFRRLSSYDILYAALPVYLSYFFLMHDCEQIRLAVAVAFIMMAYVFRVEARKWYTWIPLWIVGVLFHYSSLVAIVPLVLYSSKDMTWLWKISLVSLIFLGVVIWILKIDVFSMIPIPGLDAKMALYELAIAKGEQLETIPLFYPVALLRYLTFFYVLYQYDVIRPYVKGLNILLVADALGLAAWGALSGVAVFAVRISEFFIMPEAILFASVQYTVRPQWLGKFYPMAAATFILLYGIIMINQFGYI